jgi:membrane-associated phospholipid phosphatase
MQQGISDSAGKNWKAFSDLGGSKEILVLLGVGFLLCTREKYFYFLSVYCLDKMQIGYLKLAFHDPRPYMAQGLIHPHSCSKAFGNPSGHSSASWAFAIVVFLESMHGKWHYKLRDGSPATTFYSWWVYVLVLLLCLSWGIMIPISRYILGVHSLD